MRRAFLPFVFFLELAGIALPASPATASYAVEGTVIDRLTRQPLPYAQVIVDEARELVRVDSAGRFRVVLPGPGVYRLRASAPLHETSTWAAVTLSATAPLARADMELEPQTYNVPTVEIYGERLRPDPPQAPSRLLLASDIRRAPGGFQDPLRALQESRSIESRNDLGTLLTMRGGEPDQILFLMDGFDIYNPYRMRIVLGGGLSLANPDLVEAVELYAGGFSARYGNRATGMIQIKTREGNRQGFRSRQTLSLIAASSAFEGPLAGGRGSWILGARRTYYDLIIRPPKGQGTQYPYLQELQGRLDWDLSRGQRLTLRAAAGDEGVDVLFQGEGAEQDADTDGSSTTANVSLEHAAKIGAATLSTSRVAFLADRTRLHVMGTEDFATYANARTRALRFSSSHEWEWKAPPHLARVGAALDQYDSMVDWSADSDPAPNINPTPSSLEIDGGLTYRAGWIEDVVALRESWFLSLGIRFEDASGPSPLQASPRVALRGQLPGPVRFRIGAGQFLQYPDGIQSFSREAPLAITSFAALRPERANLASFGLSGGWRRLDWDVEAYTRDTRDLLVPAERETYAAADVGRALARGVEAEIGLRPAPRNGGTRHWHDDLELHLAHAVIDSRFRGGIYDRWTTVSAEREQSFLARTRFPVTSRMQLSFVLRLASGAPYTPLLARVAQWNERGEIVYRAIWGDPFAARSSAYGRLDVRLERSVVMWGRRGAAFFEVMNLTNRRNTLSIQWNRNLDRRRPLRGMPILPFVGLSIWG